MLFFVNKSKGKKTEIKKRERIKTKRRMRRR